MDFIVLCFYFKYHDKITSFIRLSCVITLIRPSLWCGDYAYLPQEQFERSKTFGDKKGIILPNFLHIFWSQERSWWKRKKKKDQNGYGMQACVALYVRDEAKGRSCTGYAYYTKQCRGQVRSGRSWLAPLLDCIFNLPQAISTHNTLSLNNVLLRQLKKKILL